MTSAAPMGSAAISRVQALYEESPVSHPPSRSSMGKGGSVRPGGDRCAEVRSGTFRPADDRDDSANRRERRITGWRAAFQVPDHERPGWDAIDGRADDPAVNLMLGFQPDLADI